jgi:hypothetical protein
MKPALKKANVDAESCPWCRSCQAKGGDDGLLYRTVSLPLQKRGFQIPLIQPSKTFSQQQDIDFDATSLDLSIMYFSQ